MAEPWSDRVIARYSFRAALFARRGLTEPAAEALAERLVERDADRDDRRCCLECAHLQRSGTCFALRQELARLEALPEGERRAARRASWARFAVKADVIPDLLLRCERFAFVTP